MTKLHHCTSEKTVCSAMGISDNIMEAKEIDLGDTEKCQWGLVIEEAKFNTSKTLELT